MGRFSEDIIRLFEFFKEETGKYKDLDLGKIKFRNIKLDKLFEARGGSSKYTKKYIQEHTGKYPLLTGKLDNESIEGYIDTYDFEGECITYNKDNAGGSKIFYRPKGFKFSMNSHHVALFKRDTLTQEIKEIDDINYKYCMYALNRLFEIKKFGWKESANWNRIKGEEISIPEPLGNYTSYDIQKAIADFIEFVTLKSEEIQKLMDEIISKTALLRKTLLIKLFTKLPYKKRNGKEDLTDLFKLFDEVFKKEFREYKDLNLKKVKFKKEELGNIAKEIISGFAYGKSVDEGLPHLRPNNIGEDGNLNFLKVKYIPNDEKKKRELYLLKAGDILFNNTNSIDLVGKTCYINSDMEAVFSNHITRIRVKEDYDSKYLALNLQSLFISGYFKNIATRWVNQAGINIERLKETKIPIPEPLENSYTSYDIQKAIADFVEFINRKLDFCKEFAEEYKSKSIKLNKLLLRKIFG